MAIPVHIVGGFLGTGKTTLIRNQLEQRRDENVAVIVNDFGEAALDEATLGAEEPFTLTNIPGGCVCCTAPEGFVEALGAVLEQGPDRLLIEPTGLARPQDLVDTIRRCPHKDALEVGPVVIVVDPARLGREPDAESELIELQAGIADIVVANRTDLCEDADLERFDAFVATLWPPPLSVHRTTHSRLPRELLDWPEGEGSRLSRVATAQPVDADLADPTGHDHSTENYSARSLRWSPEVVFSGERLERAALRMSQGLAGGKLARLKGIFHTDEGFVRLEVAGDTTHRERSAWRRDSRVDLIFRDADESTLDTAAGLLAGAELANQELEARLHQIELALPDETVRIVGRDALLDLPGGIPDVSVLFPKRAGAAASLESLWQAHGLPEQGEAIVCAADGFASEPVPFAALRQGVLIHSLDDEPLPLGKGGPFRLMIPPDTPGLPSACANVKSVVRIVMREASDG